MINYKNQIEDSKNLISKLEKNKVILHDKDKQLIIDSMYQLMIESYQAESNGCDCGQMTCLICHG